MKSNLFGQLNAGMIDGSLKIQIILDSTVNKYKKEAQQEFGYILHQLRPNDWNLFINSADDLALFNSICTRLVKFPNQTEINELILAINETLSKIALINKPEVGNYGDMPKEYYPHM